MSKTELGAGKDVLAYCGKCKLALNHVIIVMKNASTIGKCKCKTCGAEHLYRDPNQADKKTKSKTPRKSSSKAIPIAEVWKNALENAQGESKSYNIKNEFQVGDIIEHPKFGKGVVQKNLGPNKVETIFESDLKILACAR